MSALKYAFPDFCNPLTARDLTMFCGASKIKEKRHLGIP